MSAPSHAPAPVHFTLATSGDADLLVGLMREFYAYEHLEWDEAAARQALGVILGDRTHGEVWIVRRGGEDAGYFVLSFGFSLEFRGRFALLDELYLREEHRGGGIGRLAIRHAEEVCRAGGIRALRLEVERKNAAARAFYRAAGFAEHDRDLLTRWVPADPAE